MSLDDHSLCTFQHLIDYGSKYYTYLWSKDLALKLFDHIQAHGGLDNPTMGQRYIQKIIGRGGGLPAEQLLEDFFAP